MRGIHQSLVSSPHKGQWRRALMFSLICVWTNNWINNWDAGGLRCHHAHYNFTVMFNLRQHWDNQQLVCNINYIWLEQHLMNRWIVIHSKYLKEFKAIYFSNYKYIHKFCCWQLLCPFDWKSTFQSIMNLHLLYPEDSFSIRYNDKQILMYIQCLKNHWTNKSWVRDFFIYRQINKSIMGLDKDLSPNQCQPTFKTNFSSR